MQLNGCSGGARCLACLLQVSFWEHWHNVLSNCFSRRAKVFSEAGRTPGPDCWQALQSWRAPCPCTLAAVMVVDIILRLAKLDSAPQRRRLSSCPSWVRPGNELERELLSYAGFFHL